MNAPFVVAQVSSNTTGQSPAPSRIIKLEKPQGDQAIVLNLDGNTRLDFSAIASEKITLVKVGNRLVILFDNNTTIALEPFFDANGQPLPIAGIDLDGNRIVTPEQFAGLFPITDDQSVLPAAGQQGSPQNTGGQFESFTIQDLLSGTPLDLLGNEGPFGPFASTAQLPFLDDAVILPTSGGLTLLLDDEGLPDGNPGGTGDDGGGFFGAGTLPHDFGSGGVGTLSFAPMHLVQQTIGGVTYEFIWDAATGTLTATDLGSGDAKFEIVLNQTTGAFTVELLSPITHPLVDTEDNLLFNLTYDVINTTNGLTDTGTLTLDIDDDTPEIGDPRRRTVDEDGLRRGNEQPAGANGDVPHADTSKRGSLDISWGADNANPNIDASGPGDRSVAFANIVNGDPVLQANGQPLLSNGKSVIYDIHSPTEIYGLVLGAGPRGSDLEVFHITLSDKNNGSYKFELLDNVDHRDNNRDNENNIRLDFDFTATDSDGDTAQETFIVRIDDDTPIVRGPAENERVREENLPLTIADLFGFDCGCSVIQAGNLKISWGADRGRDKHIELTDWSSLPVDLKSDGVDVLYAKLPGPNGSDILLAYRDAPGGPFNPANWVFGLGFVEAGSGTYIFVQFDNLDHVTAGGQPLDRIPLHFTVNAVDSDGDGVAQDFTVRIIDDTPQIGRPENGTVEEEQAQVAGDGNEDNTPGQDRDSNADGPNETTHIAIGALNIAWGADDHDAPGRDDGVGRTVVFTNLVPAANITAVDENGNVIALTSRGETVEFRLEDNGTRLVGYVDLGGGNTRDVFRVSLNDDGDGSYRFRLLETLDHADGNGENILRLKFDFSAVDGDLDRADDSFTVRVIDDVPLIAGPVEDGIVEEEQAIVAGAGNEEWLPSAEDPDFAIPPFFFSDSLDEVATGDLGIAWGADSGNDNNGQPGDRSVAFVATTEADLDVLNLTSRGELVKYTKVAVAGGEVLLAYTGNIVPLSVPTSVNAALAAGIVFAIGLTDSGSGAYGFRLFDTIDHQGSVQGEDTLNLDFQFVATDSDGDTTAPGSFSIGIIDDKPVALGTILPRFVEEEELAGGNEDDAPGLLAPDGDVNFFGFQNLTTDQASGPLNIGWGGDDSNANVNGGFTGTQVPGDRSVIFSVANPSAAVDRVLTGAEIDGFVSVSGGGLSASGLTSGGEPLIYVMSGNNTVLTAYAGVDGPLVFTVTLSDTGSGAYLFDLDGVLDHPVTGDSPDDEDVLSLTFNFTARDGDGDIATDNFVVKIIDDSPVVDVAAGNALVHDETPGDQTGGNRDDDAAAQAAFAALEGAGGPLNGLTALGYADQNAAVTVTPDYGADGPGATQTTLALTQSDGSAFDGQATNLRDTETGDRIFLFTDASGAVFGRAGNGNTADENGEIVFALVMDDSGTLSLAQYRAISHGNPNDADEARRLLAQGAGGDEIVFVTATSTDGDDDTATTTSDGLDIRFRDDGPTTSQADRYLDLSEADPAPDSASKSFTIDFGADGYGSTAFTGAMKLDIGPDVTDNIFFDVSGGAYRSELTADGKAVTFERVDDNTIRGFVASADNNNNGDIEVFELKLTDTDTSVTGTLFTNIDHLAYSDGSPLTTLRIDATIAFADGDGDTVTSIVRVNVADDGLSVGRPDDGAVTEDVVSVPVANAGFDQQSLASGEPGVIIEPVRGNYTTGHPAGWTLSNTGNGGIYAPISSIIDPAGSSGHQVAWIRSGTTLSQTTGETFEEGEVYTVRVTVGDRTDQTWPGGEVRLVATVGTVLATLSLPTPPNGGWTTVELNSLPITAQQAIDLAGQELRIEIVDSGAGGQILIDNVEVTVTPPIGDTGSLAIDWGADNIDNDGQPVDRSVAFAPALGTGTGTPVTTANGAVTSSGANVLLVRVSDTEIVGVADDNNDNSVALTDRLVFRVTLDDGSAPGDQGSYQFVLLDNLDHVNAGEDVSLALDFGYVATDSDGDTAPGSFTVTVSDDPDRPAIGNTIANGDFTQGDWPNVESWGVWDTTPEGWIVTPSDIGGATGSNIRLEKIVSGYAGMSTPNGAPMVDLGATPGNVTLSQEVIGLVEGQSYVIEFHAGAPHPASALLQVIWGGVVIDTIAPTGAMTLYRYTIAGGDDAAANTLTFKEIGSGGDNHGTYLANVAMNVVVDEDDLPAGTDTSPESVSITGNLNVSWGADDANPDTGTIDRSLVFTTASAPTGLTSDGVDILYAVSGDTLIAYKGTDHTIEANQVFVVTLTDELAGGYEFTLKGNLDHGDGGGENGLPLTFDFNATDADGDVASGSFEVVVRDDVPTAVKDDSVTIDEDGVASGNVMTNDIQGADGATLTSVTFDGGATWQIVNSSGTTAIPLTGVGTYEFGPNGAWTFTPEPNFNGSTSFAYIITDSDGDESDPAVTIDNTVEIVINPVNDAPIVTGGTLAEVSESGDVDGIGEAGLGGALRPLFALSSLAQQALSDLTGNSSQGAFDAAFSSLLTDAGNDVAAANNDVAAAVAAMWTFLDPLYPGTPSSNPADPLWNNAVNAHFVRLGVKYADYVKGGGMPLIDVIAKFTPDNAADANTTLERSQSLHDNLLANLDDGPINNRFNNDGPDDLLDELLGAVASVDSGLFNRPSYSGNEGVSDTAARNWDADHAHAVKYVPHATGTIAVSDPDGGAPSFTYSGTGVGAYGRFSIDPVTGKWTYTLDDSKAATQELREGVTGNESFEVTVNDGNGGITQTSVVITIHGTNDAPVITGGVTTDTVFEGGDLDDVTEANEAANFKFEPGQNLDSFIAGQLAAPGYDMDDVLTAVLGQMPSEAGLADAIAAVWDYIDDNYSYYNNAINEAAAKLGLSYAQYLKDGNRPLTDVTVKFTPDGADAGLNPDREQSLHDNLLGNLDEPSLADKLLGHGAGGSNPNPVPDVYNDLVAAITTAGLAGRPIYGGYEGTPNDALAFDIAHGLLSAASGQFTANDVDLGETATLQWSVANANGAYGTLAIDPVTGAWTYTLDDSKAETQALAEGQTEQDIFAVIVEDVSGGIGTINVTITVKGTNDAPVITGPQQIAIVNPGFEADTTYNSSAPEGRWTNNANPSGWTLSGSGSTAGWFDPGPNGPAGDAGVVPMEPDNGTNILYLNDGRVASQTLGQNAEAGRYELSVEVGDRSNANLTGLPQFAVRLYAGTELVAEQIVPSQPADGPAWTNVTLQALIDAASPGFGQPLRIELANLETPGAGGDFSSVTQVNFDNVSLTYHATVVTGAVTESGDLAGIAEAGAAGGLEPDAALLTPAVTAALGTLPATPSDIPDVLDTIEAQVGDRATAIAIVWDYLDDNYVAGTPYNEAFVRLGVEYARYLKAGGTPLIDVTAKFEPDNFDNPDDGDTTPDRNQTLHDNLLGNLNGGVMAGSSRFGSDPDLLNELTNLVKGVDENLLTREWSSGDDNTGDLADLAAGRAWDIANGFVPMATGQVAASDVDQGHTLTFSADTTQGIYGAFAIDANTGEWTYRLDNHDPDTQALAQGENGVETFKVTVTDEHGAVDTVDVVVNVAGSNDVNPVLLYSGDPASGGQLIAGFTTIQDAIDAAVDGNFVLIPAGTYKEMLSIDGKDISLVGEGDTTIITPPDGAIETTITVAGSSRPDKSAIISVEDATVTIKDIKVDGEGRGNERESGTNDYNGIVMHNAGGTVENVTITGIREPLDGNGHVSGNQLGVGFYVFNTDGVGRGINFRNNTVEDFQKNATVFAGDGLIAEVSGNTIVGNGGTPTIAQNGLQFSSGVTGVATNNTITDIGWFWSGVPGTTKWTSSGILVLSADVDVTDNTVTAPSDVPTSPQELSATGIYVQDDPNGSTILLNTVDGFTYGVISYLDGAQPDIADNTYHGDAVNLFFSTPDVGAFMAGTNGVDVFEGGAGNDNFFGLGNADQMSGAGGDDRLTGGAGDDAIDGGADADTAWYPSTTLTTADVTYDDVNDQWLVDATAGGEGNDTVVNVNVIQHDIANGGSNFLLVGGGGFATIQDAIDAAADGDTILIAPGTYNESLEIDGLAITLVAAGDVTVDPPAGENGLNILGPLAGGDVTIKGVDFTGGESGIFVAQNAGIGTLTVDGSEISGNSEYGIFADRALMNAISVVNSKFVNNGAGYNGSAQIKLWGFFGVALFQHLLLEGAAAGTRPDYGIELTGMPNPVDGTALPIGNVQFDDVTVSGLFNKNGVAIYNYADINQLAISDLDLSAVVTGWGPVFNIDGVAGNIDAALFDIVYPAGTIVAELQGDKPTQPAADQTITGTDANEFLNGNAGNDTLNAGGGNDILAGGGGDDSLSGGEGDDTAYYAVGHGRDVIDGGTETTADTLDITGSGANEQYEIWSVDAYNAAHAGNEYNGSAEILVTVDDVIVTEASEIEEIVVHGGGGTDTLGVNGSYAGTHLLTSTITYEGGSGDDAIDLFNRQSAHRVVVNGQGGNDTVTLGFNFTDLAPNAVQYLYAEDGTTVIGVSITHAIDDGDSNTPDTVTDQFYGVESFSFTDGDRTPEELFDANAAPKFQLRHGDVEFLVNTETDASQYEQTVTTLADGRFVVAWRTADPDQDGSSSAVKAQIFHADGGKAGGEFLVNSQTTSSQITPTITGLTNGGFVVAWRTSDGGSNGDIKAQIFNADGDPVGSEFPVNTETVDYQWEPVVTALADGEFVVVWHTYDESQDNSESAIKASIFDADGNVVKAEFLVNTETAGAQYEPTVTTLANGDFAVAWRTNSDPADGDKHAVKAQIFHADGSKAGGEFLVNSETDENQNEPAIAALSNGGFVVTWITDAPGQDADRSAIKARIFNEDGSAAEAEFLVNSEGSGDQLHPTVTALAGGRFVVAWYTGHPSPDTSGRAIKAQVFEANGDKVGAEFLVSDEPFDTQNALAAITALADGGFVVTWYANGNSQDTDGTAIKARIFHLSNETGNIVETESSTGTHSIDGALFFTDADLTDIHDVSVNPLGSYVGTFDVAVDEEPAAGQSGKIIWTFDVDESEINGLAQDEVLTQTYEVNLDDGHGGIATELVTVTITGTNDAPLALDDTIIVNGYPDSPPPGFATSTPVFDETEANDIFSDPNVIDRSLLKVAPNAYLGDQIAPSVTVRGAIFSDDVDYYAIDLKAGETLVLDVDTDTPSTAGSALTTVIQLHAPGGDSVAIGGGDDYRLGGQGSVWSHGNWDSDDAYLKYTALTAGTYYFYLDRGASANDVGQYDLQVSIEDFGGQPPVTVPVAALLANDSDPDGDSLDVVSVSGNGVRLSGDNVIVQHGVTSFDYIVSDGKDQHTATVTVAQESDGISLGTGGADTLVGGNTVDQLFGAEGADLLFGGLGNDSLYGGDGADTLVGGNGSDLLSGGNGADLLFGGLGNDVMYGDAGDDTLRGGEGNDALNGGGGADVFGFAEAGSGNVDIIVGFSQDDKLDLSELLDAAFQPGDPIGDYVNLVETAAPFGASDIRVQVDVDGAANGQVWADVAVLSFYGTTSNADIVKMVFEGTDHQMTA